MSRIAGSCIAAKVGSMRDHLVWAMPETKHRTCTLGSTPLCSLCLAAGSLWALLYMLRLSGRAILHAGCCGVCEGASAAGLESQAY